MKGFILRSYILTLLLLLSLSGCIDDSSKDLISKDKIFNHQSQIGFFEPTKIYPEYASKVDIQVYNLSTVELLKENLQLAKQQGLRLFLVAGMRAKPREDIVTNYSFSGEVHNKKLKPHKTIKLRTNFTREEIFNTYAPFMEVAKKYPEVIEAVFLTDEPYLNGLSYQQLDQVGNDVRTLLDTYGLEKTKVGAIFASAMFNSDFAKQIDRASSLYVNNIDKHFSNLKLKQDKGVITPEESNWLAIIEEFRLTTYDKANNMYTGGGIPESLDIVGFDLYLSTLLQDAVHNESLSWFAKQNLHPSCIGFEGSTMVELRKGLSFFGGDGSLAQDESIKLDNYNNDKSILERWYSCRTESALALLYKEIEKSSRKNRDIILVSESSTNGFMSFDQGGNVSAEQDMELTHQRVTDEVLRAFKLIEKYPVSYLLFFTYGKNYDKAIKLNIGGVESIDDALQVIYKNSKRNVN